MNKPCKCGCGKSIITKYPSKHKYIYGHAPCQIKQKANFYNLRNKREGKGRIYIPVRLTAVEIAELKKPYIMPIRKLQDLQVGQFEKEVNKILNQ